MNPMEKFAKTCIDQKLTSDEKDRALIETFTRIQMALEVFDAALRDVEREQRRHTELIAELIKRQGVNTAIKDIRPSDILGDLK